MRLTYYLTRIFFASITLVCFSFIYPQANNFLASQNKVLVFSKTNGYRHQSIETGIESIKKLGNENNFAVDATEDSLFLTDANLKNYKTI